MTRPILVVPGFNGSGEGHWQRHWLADHDTAELVEQGDWANPHAGRWLHRLERAVIANPGALIVAHSLGSILAARLATSSVASLVGGALLVAPADIERTGTLHALTPICRSPDRTPWRVRAGAPRWGFQARVNIVNRTTASSTVS